MEHKKFTSLTEKKGLNLYKQSKGKNIQDICLKLQE